MWFNPNSSDTVSSDAPYTSHAKTLARALTTQFQKRENLEDEIKLRNRNIMAEENFYRYHFNL